MTRWWLQMWPFHERLPERPEPATEQPGDGRIPGLIDESN